MAVVVVTTIGGADSNSYCSVAEADAYHEAHLYATDWTGASATTKDVALVMATRILDEQMEWVGTKHDDVQALRWPRDGTHDKDDWYIKNDELPSKLVEATAEMARMLIAGDRTEERETIGIKSLSVGSIDLEFDKNDEAPTVPDSVYDMISHLGTRRFADVMVDLVRV